MKPQRFEIGQAVTPRYGVDWNGRSPNYTDVPSPKMDVLHVSSYKEKWGYWYIRIVEMPQDCYYREDQFEPLISDSELARELESIEVPQTI